MRNLQKKLMLSVFAFSAASVYADSTSVPCLSCGGSGVDGGNQIGGTENVLSLTANTAVQALNNLSDAANVEVLQDNSLSNIVSNIANDNDTAGENAVGDLGSGNDTGNENSIGNTGDTGEVNNIGNVNGAGNANKVANLNKTGNLRLDNALKALNNGQSSKVLKTSGTQKAL